jgi:hypothetical protein
VGSKGFANDRCQCVGIIGKGLFDGFLWLPIESRGERFEHAFEHRPGGTVGPGCDFLRFVNPLFPLPGRLFSAFFAYMKVMIPSIIIQQSGDTK